MSALRRGGPLKRKKPMNKVNPKRRQKERTRAYGSPRRREWYASQPCVACGRQASRAEPNHNCHIKPHTGLPSGVGRKGDKEEVVTLCPACHFELDQVLGQRAFEDKWQIDLDFKAILQNDEWLERDGK